MAERADFKTDRRRSVFTHSHHVEVATVEHDQQLDNPWPYKRTGRRPPVAILLAGAAICHHPPAWRGQTSALLLLA